MLDSAFLFVVFCHRISGLQIDIYAYTLDYKKKMEL